MQQLESSARSTHAAGEVRVAGFGLVSPIGLTAWETFGALLAGKSITDRIERLPQDITPDDLVKTLGSVVFAQHAVNDPSVDLAERASREAISQAGWLGTGDRQELADVPLYLGVSKGAMHALAGALERHAGLRGARTGGPKSVAAPPIADCHLAVTLGPCEYLAHHLRRRLGVSEVHTVVAACASSLTALHMARLRLLTDPTVSRVLVATSEAALMPAFIHSYQRLGVLPGLTPADCRISPLDETRSGFLPVEIAAAVALERLPGEDAAASVVKPSAGSLKSQIVLVDTLTGCEGYDLIRTAPEMSALAHVAQRLFHGRRIDLLHPHATGTPDHDPAELAALARACQGQGRPPDVYASKGALGHGLGAAGLVSLVIGCMCGVARRRPVMKWLRQPIRADIPLSSIEPGPLGDESHHGIFAAGFGGHIAGAVVRVRKS